MSKNNSMRKRSTVFQSPFKILYILIPIIIALYIGNMTMGSSDTFEVIRWILVMMLFGFAFFPLSSFIFKKSCSGGFIFGESLGILTVSLVSWTLGYIGILPFTRTTIIILLIISTAICYAVTPLRKALVHNLSKNGVAENILFEQIVFSVTLTILCYYKGFLPNINGQEKFMDYGFIMSMLRNPNLPAKDMWLSGKSINYYYFGQFIFSLIIKLTGIKPSIAYNIAMCSAIAFPFALCYGIGTYLVDTARSFGLKAMKYMHVICGILCGFITMIFGNSHSFFYDDKSMGNHILKLFSKLGVNVGKTDNFFFPESTRFIGHNPDSALIEGIKNGGDYTISEFPFYTYLLGDLHAHVCSSMVVLTIIAVSIAFISRIGDNLIGEKNMIQLPFLNSLPENLPANFTIKDEYLSRVKSQWKRIINVELVTISILLGIAQMTNYWDFLIYFIFTAMVLFIVMTRTSNDFSTIPGAFVFGLIIFDILSLYLGVADNPLLHVALQFVVLILAYFATCYVPCALSRIALGMSFVFTVSNIVALSFNLSFDMISNTLALCQNHSSLFQLWILYGTHVFICGVFVAFTIIGKNYTLDNGIKKNKKVSVIGVSPTDHINPISKFFGERNIIDVFVCGMIVVGLLMLIAPEIFYVRDIYVGGYLRANTMFKFSYAAFILLSIAAGYSIFRLFWIINKKGEFSLCGFVLGLLCLILLIVPAHYPSASLPQRCSGNTSKENYKGLDGTAYLYTYTCFSTPLQEPGNILPYAEAIAWFNDYVPGNPVILETYGDSYTDYDMISAYTGLQTVCGWQTHEQLWRFHGIVNPETNLLVSDPSNDVWENYLIPRHTDIDTVYTNSDPAEVQKIIDKYQIEYIVIGDLEMYRHAVDNSLTFDKLGDVVFQSGTLKVYKVTPASV
ncbi:MAG: DUF2298 domain-containing protein [Saccharofermentans sp.]|nr:DUF2298 domain-containing protein [Saccharofermentans sp.]